MAGTAGFSRREILSLLPGAAQIQPPGGKPMRGIFIILATPYTEKKEVDYEDLAREVGFLDRCGVQGLVWPQLASEYQQLTVGERLRGMEILASAARGKRAALVLGVQGRNTEQALAYARKAEELAPDAVIATPPGEGRSLEEVREYYSALARLVKRPCFVQTTGGAKGLDLPVDFIVSLAREFPNLAYVKEELDPVIGRMRQLAAARPVIRSIFSGRAGRALLYEMRLGMDGTMPGAAYADIYAMIWRLYHSERQPEARDLFARLLLMINVAEQAPAAILYILRKRGVFKTMQSRQRTVELSRHQIDEIEFCYAALASYLKD
jgi:4-hydroxy-tetrahydrodipicolinate synthase